MRITIIAGSLETSVHSKRLYLSNQHNQDYRTYKVRVLSVSLSPWKVWNKAEETYAVALSQYYLLVYSQLFMVCIF